MMERNILEQRKFFFILILYTHVKEGVDLPSKQCGNANEVTTRFVWGSRWYGQDTEIYFFSVPTFHSNMTWKVRIKQPSLSIHN